MLAKKCLLMVMLTLFSMSLAIADPPAVNPATGEPLMVDCLRGTVTVDGDLSDWNLEAMTPAVIDAAEQVNSASWDNAADCSGEVYLLWDDVNIYMAAVIKDDKLSMNKTDGSIWNADCVEVFFSTLNAVADHSEHYQYGFNANNQKWNWCNMDGAGSVEPAYLQIAATATADGYICEASVEYAMMPALDFSAGNTIGFHPCIDDTDIDDGDTEYQMSWTGLAAHDQSTGFGHMLLSDEAVPASDGWQSQDIDATDGSVVEVDGTWTISGEGADVWGTADQFHYAYSELSGDAVIVARVVDNGTGSNAWAKGGVMIRQSTEPGSVHALMAITGGNGGGGAFQWRPEADGGSSSAHDDAAGMAPGYFVKLERVGNDFTGSYSADGVTWIQQGEAQTIEMADPALIGLFVTSHADGEIRTYTFDSVSVVTMFDVTAPGDVVQGVPNDGDWPGGETPDLAFDDDTSTKYLHFKGDFDPDPNTGGSGLQITPAAGKTIVTGLTLTTANDVPGRDPIAFELSGSNDSIDGPYTVIASGDIVDFAMEAEWPRFTMNETEISFENDNAYAHYQLIFTAIRGPVGGSVNSMQIAEVELLGVPLTPVGHWTFDEGAGTVALDSSGNGNDGTLEDEPVVVEGQFGLALAFDGSRVAIPASDSLSADLFQGTFTMSGWINPTRAGNTWQQVFRSVTASATNDTLFLNNDGRLSWRGTVGGSWAGGMCETAPDVAPAGQWTHVAVTGDGTNFRIYVNGALSQESAFQTTDGENETYYIGGDTNLGESYAGMIDDVRIYNQALSSAEVSELAGKAADPSLVIYYSFDEVGDIVADQSGKGHDGAVVGDVTAEADGKIGGAANFATGSYLDLDGPSIPAEDIPTSAMTLAAWIKIANTGGDHEIFSARASDESWLIHPEPKSSGDIRWLLRSYGGTTIFQIRAGVVTWDQWLHFAGTYDKDTAKAALYINGELIEEMDVTSPADIAGDWDLGARVGLTIDDGRPFTGLMDEFRMYTRALSQDEILEVMQGM